MRKQLLDDLYVRFFRIAEERIGEAAEYGIVSFISNSSYLTGRSHPIMRSLYCRTSMRCGSTTSTVTNTGQES